MDLSQITATQPELFETPTGAPKDELGRADFLRMLIAQLENQDPLDPQDATEFTAQLAQFSSLDQLVSMRSAIDSLASASGVSDGLAAAGLIGRDALVETRSLSVPPDGAALPEVVLELASSAEVLSVEVVDAAGRTVATTSGLGTLAAGRHAVEWSDFDRVPRPGLHTLRVTTAQGAAAPRLLVRAPVTGAALEPSGAVLLLGDAEVPLSALREIAARQVAED